VDTAKGQGWAGPVQRETTLEEVQAMLDDMGAYREKRSPVARIDHMDDEDCNVAYAYAKDGTVLAQWAWRPFYDRGNHLSREMFAKHHGLFISG
jgi:hypothetical protein